MFDNHKVTEEVKKERLDICNACEHNALGVCKKCGCVLVLKTQWKVTSCPIGKWGKIQSS